MANQMCEAVRVGGIAEGQTCNLQGPVTVVHEQDEITKVAERELAQRFREDVAEVLVAGEPLEDELTSLGHRAYFVEACADVARSLEHPSGKSRLDCGGCPWPGKGVDLGSMH